MNDISVEKFLAVEVIVDNTLENLQRYASKSHVSRNDKQMVEWLEGRALGAIHLAMLIDLLPDPVWKLLNEIVQAHGAYVLAKPEREL